MYTNNSYRHFIISFCNYYKLKLFSIENYIYITDKTYNNELIIAVVPISKSDNPYKNLLCELLEDFDDIIDNITYEESLIDIAITFNKLLNIKEKFYVYHFEFLSLNQQYFENFISYILITVCTDFDKISMCNMLNILNVFKKLRWFREVANNVNLILEEIYIENQEKSRISKNILYYIINSNRDITHIELCNLDYIFEWLYLYDMNRDKGF